MGCWSETCFLTNLPIFHDEEIVVLPIVQNYACGRDKELSMSYSFERWKPFSFPIRATYDDYGTPENIIKGFEYDIFNFMIDKFLSNKDEIEIRSEDDYDHDIALWRHISKGKGIHIPTRISGFGEDNPLYISFVMMKASVFDALVNEAPPREFRPLSREQLENEDFVDFVEACGIYRFDEASRERREASKLYVALFSHYERGFGLTRVDTVRFLEQYIDTYDRNDIKKAVIDFVLFMDYVDSLRLIMAPTTGKGSQSIEENIHLKLNVLRTIEIKKIMEI